MNIFQQYLSYGLSVIPCEMKRPVCAWKEYQTKLPTHENAALYQSSQIAIVCGAISGGLICIDFDVKNGDKYNPWILLINDQYPELLSKLVIEKSPSGGFHVVFRSDYQIGNVKLAVNPDMKCTIETRGEGGYFVCAPSPGYTLEYEDFSKIQKLTVEEAEILIQTAKSFNEYVTEQNKHAEPPSNLTGLSPFNDYNARNDISSLLVKHGWKELFRRNNAVYFQRPGKNDRSISASWNVIPERFYVFTTSSQFENMKTYKQSAVYTILEHNGNFNESAKLLYANGYGDRVKKTEEKKEGEKKYEVQLIRPDKIKEKIFEVIKNGYKKGKTTGWQSLDNLYSVIRGQFTVITGLPSSGKSEFLDALAINLMAKDKWKFAVFSPENYPMEMHYHKLIEKICNCDLRSISQENLEAAIEIINQHFFFIDALEEDVDLNCILGQTEILIKEKNIDGLIIDPWNEIELSKPREISDSDFIGICLRKCRKFARKHNIHLWIVCHPTKMMKNKDGEYDIPELYDCAGSAHWRNKADNGICVHRDMVNNLTAIHVQKIKFRYAGKPGSVIFNYDIKSGRYNETERNFDNTLCDRY